MAIRHLCKWRHSNGQEFVGTAQPVTVAKALARQLIFEFGRIDLPKAIVGTALAMVVATIAAELTPAHREGFYEKFITAVRESDIEWEIACGRLRPLH